MKYGRIMCVHVSVEMSMTTGTVLISTLNKSEANVGGEGLYLAGGRGNARLFRYTESLELRGVGFGSYCPGPSLHIGGALAGPTGPKFRAREEILCQS